jgi:uncharacterized protein YdaU (DUF1376 family)
MKYYPRDPDAALAGMAELNFEQRGAYNSLLDLLYSRDGMVPDDDRFIARCLQCDPRQWRRLKRELMTAAKVRVTVDGLLTANGVDERRCSATSRSTRVQHAARAKWENFRKAKKNNGPSMPSKSKSKYSSLSSSSLSTPPRASFEPMPAQLADALGRLGKAVQR